MSRVVDKRVVEMGFDNSNFEKNVAQSMATTEKLKKSLKFEGLGKGLDDIDKAASKVDLGRIANAAEALQRRFSVLGEIGHNAMMKIVNGVTQLSTGMFSFIKQGVVSGGIKRAMNLEQANFMMQGLLKNEAAVAAIMQDVSKSVDGTAYSLDAAAKVAAQFAATGMRAGDQMYGALRGVAGVAAMTNAEYEQIGLIFTQVAGQGRLMGDQLLQLSTRGINAAATLTTYMNKMGITANATEGDIRKMVSEGEISFELFAAAMDDAFGEHALKANETFQGAMSNIRSALARIGADFVAPLIKQNGQLVQLFNSIRVAVNNIRKLTTPYATAAADWVIDMAAGLTNVVDSISAVLSGTYEVNNATRTWVSIINSVKNVIAGLKSVTDPIKLAWKDVFPEGIKINILAIAEAIERLTGKARLNLEQMTGLRAVFTAVFTAVKMLCELIGPVLNVAFAALGKILNIVSSAFTKISTPISKALASFMQTADKVNFLHEALNKLANALRNSGGKIKTWFNQFMALPQVQTALAAFNDLLGKLKVDALKVFDEMGGTISEFVRKAMNDISSITWTDVKNLFKSLKDSIVNTFGPTVTTWFKNFKNSFGSMREFIVTACGNIGEGFLKVWDVVSNVVTLIWNKLTEIPLGSFVSVGFGAALMLLVNKIIDLVNFLKAPIANIKGLFNDVRSVIQGFAKIESAYAAKINSEAIFTIAKAIAVFAGSLIAVAQVPTDRLWEVTGVMGALTGMVAGLGLAFAGINKMGGKGIDGVGVQMIAMAAAIKLMVSAFEDMPAYSLEDLGSKLLALAGLLGELVVATIAINRLGGSSSGLGGAGFTLLSLGAGLKLIMSALADMQEMNPEKAQDAVENISGLLGSLALVMIACRKVKWDAAVALLGASFAIKLMVGTVKDINKMSVVDIERGIDVIGRFESLLAALMIISRLAGKSGKAVGSAMVGFSGGVLLLLLAIKLINKIDPLDIQRGIDVIGQFELLFAGMALITRLAGKGDGKDAAIVMLAFSGSMIVLAAAIGILAMISEGDLQRCANVVTQLGIVMAAIVGLSGQAKDSKVTMGIIAGIFAEIAIALGLLANFVDPSNLKNAADSLTEVIAACAILTGATKLAKDAKLAMGSIMGVVVILAGTLAMLGSIPMTDAIEKSNALSTLLVAFSAAMVIMGHAKSISSGAIAGAYAMSGVVAVLAACMIALNEVQTDGILIKVTALSEILIVVAAIVALFGGLGLGGGALASAGMGALAMLEFIGILGAGLIGIGALFENIQGLEPLLDKGIDILKKLGIGLGEALGGFVSGFLDQASQGLVAVGKNLTKMSKAMKPFFDDMDAMPDNLPDKVKKFASMIIALGTAELYSAVTSGLSWLFGGYDMSTLQNELVTFANAVRDFCDVIGMTEIDDGKIESVKKISVMFAAIQEALPKEGGFVSYIVGQKQNFGDFGKAIEAFITAMVDASNAIGDAKINEEQISTAAKMGELFAVLQEKLPERGGQWQYWAGEKLSLDVFGENISAFIGSMQGASLALTLFPINAEAVSVAANMGELFLAIQTALPEQGGLWQEWITGQKSDLETFGTNCEAFAGAMTRISKKLTENPLNLGAIMSARIAGEILTALNDSLPDEVGALQKWFTGGQMSMDDFAHDVEMMAYAVSYFNLKAKNLDSGKWDAAIYAVKQLMRLFDELPEPEKMFGGNKMKLSDFGNKIESFADQLTKFDEKLKGISSAKISSSINAIKQLVEMFNGIQSINGDSLNGFNEALKTLANTGIESFTSTIGNANSDIETAAANLIATFTNALTVDPMALSIPFSQLVDNAVLTLTNGSELFKQAAIQCINAFGVGIAAGTIIASTAGMSLVTSIIGGFNSMTSGLGPLAGSNLIDAVMRGMQNKSSSITALMGTIVTAIILQITLKQPQFYQGGVQSITSFSVGMASQQAKAQMTMNLLLSALQLTIAASLSKFSNAGANIGTKVGDGVASKTDYANSKISAIVSSMAQTLRNGANQMYNAASYLVDGIVNGVNQNGWRARQAAQNLANSIAASVNAALKIHSPSQVGYEQGAYYDKGIANGLVDNKELLDKAAELLVKAITDKIDIMSEAILESMYHLGRKMMEQIQVGFESGEEVIGEMLSGVLTRQLPSVIESISKVGEEIALKIKDGITGSSDLATALETTLSNFSPDFKESMANIGKQIIARISDGVKEADNTIPEILEKIVNDVTPAILKNMGAYSTDVIMEKILEGMAEADKVTDSLKEKLIAFMPDLIEKMYDYGRKSMEQYTAGLESSFEVLGETFSSMFVRSMPEVTQSVKNLGKDISEELIKAFDEFAGFNDMFTSKITGTEEGVREAVETLSKNMLEQFDVSMTSEDALGVFKDIMSRLIYIASDNALNEMAVTGEGLIDKLIEGIKKSEDEPGKVIMSLFTEAIPKILGEFKELGTALMRGMLAAPAEIMTMSMGSIFPSMIDIFKTNGASLIDALSNAISARRSDPAYQLSRICDEMIKQLQGRKSMFIGSGGDIINGVIQGMNNKKQNAINAAIAIALAINEAFNRTLQIHSPSRVGEKSGNFYTLGIARGLINGTKNVVSSATNLAQNMRLVLDEAMLEVLDDINTDSQYSPRVTPILDLSSVRKQLPELDTTLTRTKALEIQGSFEARRIANAEQNQNGTEKTTKVENNFVQNNYSPKALSRLEIYRQTKNLFKYAGGKVVSNT